MTSTLYQKWNTVDKTQTMSKVAQRVKKELNDKEGKSKYPRMSKLPEYHNKQLLNNKIYERELLNLSPALMKTLVKNCKG